MKRTVWGLGDQGLLSIAGFITTVLLARTLAPHAFGVYTLVYSAILLANGVQTGLISAPHNVLAATRNGNSYRLYTSTAALAQVAVAVGVSCFGAAAALAFGILEPTVRAEMLAGAAVAFGSSLQNFGRRVLYTESRPAAAFFVDIVAYGGQVLLLLALHHHGSLSALSALEALAVAYTFGALFAGWQLRKSLSTRTSRADLGEMWALGKWLAANQVGNWFIFNVYLFLAAAIGGAATSAALKASQTIFGPVVALIAYLPLVLPTRFTQTLARGGREALRKEIARTYIRTSPVFAAYCAAAAIFSRELLHILYGGPYDRYSTVVALFAAYFFLGYIAEVLSHALRAERRPRDIFIAYASAGAFGVVAGWLVISLLGASGAALGLILNGAILNLVLWRALGPISPLAGVRRLRAEAGSTYEKA
jgi:O-antigen/teichoic acid export membrane protein